MQYNSIVTAWENSTTQPDLEDIYLQTRAIMFYSVPHRGSFLADYTLPFLRKSVELTEVQRSMLRVTLKTSRYIITHFYCFRL